jgi:hypothetical protein
MMATKQHTQNARDANPVAYRIRVPKHAISGKQYVEHGMPPDEDCYCVGISAEVAKYICSLEDMTPYQDEPIDYPTVGETELRTILNFITDHPATKGTAGPVLVVYDIPHDNPIASVDALVLLSKACVYMDVPTIKPFIQAKIASLALGDIGNIEQLIYKRQLTGEERIALRNRYDWSYQ